MMTILKALLILVIYFISLILTLATLVLFYAALFQHWTIYQDIYLFKSGAIFYLLVTLIGSISLYMSIAYIQYQKLKNK